VVAVKAGSRWRSVTCDTEVVIVKAPAGEVELACGGAAMVPVGTDADAGTPAAGLDEGTLIGKRYVDDDDTIEVLATKGGKGSLTVDGQRLVEKSAKPLPSSD
jgi:hypothetical protein